MISCKLVGPDPTLEAPISDGAKVGYYDDQLTRNLLALKEGDALLVTGTYGVKDLGQNPVSIVSLQDGSYDRRLVPFMPREFQIFKRHLDFHKLNQQWYVYAATARELHERLLKAIAEAKQTARGLPLSLPDYVRQLAPKLLYQKDPDKPFEFQLQPWFAKTARCVRVARILRVIGMCYAFTNLGHRILADRKEWKYGEPVGIKVPAGHNLTQDQISLLHAYHYLGATIELDGDLPPLDLATEYSYADVSAALVGKLPGGTEPQRVVEDCPDWLDGLDEDALQHSAVCPDYDKNEFDEDRIRLTAQGRRDRRELELEELESGRYDYMAVDPAGNVYPTPRSSLGVSLGAAVSGARSSALGTPVAASASPAMTTSGYSSASSSAPFISDSELYRGSRPSRRSWEWSNTNRRGQEPPTEQRWANLPSFEPSPSNQQVGQYHPLPTRGVRHSASTPQLSTSVLSCHRHPYHQPPPPTQISAAIPARTQQNILRDPRTGSVRTAQVLEVDFERLGLPAHEPRPRRRQQRGGTPAPYGRAPAPSPGPAAGYASYQEVEREEFRYQGSNQGHQGSQQEPPWPRRSEYNPAFQYSAAGPSYAPPGQSPPPPAWFPPQDPGEESISGWGVAASPALGPSPSSLPSTPVALATVPEVPTTDPTVSVAVPVTPAMTPSAPVSAPTAPAKTPAMATAMLVPPIVATPVASPPAVPSASQLRSPALAASSPQKSAAAPPP